MPDIPQTKIHPGVSPRLPEALPACEGDYAELDVSSNFSFLHAASHPDELALQAALLGHRAVAITDRNTLAGAVRMHVAAKQLRERFPTAPKLIIGARLVFVDAPDLLVWAPDRAAYGQLCRLLTLGRRRAAKGLCHLSRMDLPDRTAGLLAAAVPPTIPDDAFADTLGQWREIFGPRLSLAMSPGYGPDDALRLDGIARTARKCGVGLLATNAVAAHAPQRRPLHDVLTCIRHGCTLDDAGFRLLPNAERHLKSPRTMRRLLESFPQAVRRAVDVAEQCTFSLDELSHEHPDDFLPPGTDMPAYLRRLTEAGAARRYPGGMPPDVRATIEKELRIIRQMNFESFFLTVDDIVRFARSRGILCQGRGSAANSAVCYCLGITCVDPAKFQLVFERFASTARKEPPDIDVDFEHERREEVLQYIYDTYTRDRAGMTGVVITYRGRSAVRDVGKAMGLSPDLVDSLAAKLDHWHSGTLSTRNLIECGIDPRDPTLTRLIDLTGQLLGFPRHLSQHTGGMVITRGPLSELVPIENAAMDGRTVIEWDKDDLDALGLLKVDCLALGMLTAITKSLVMLWTQNTPVPGMPSRPTDDLAASVQTHEVTPPIPPQLVASLPFFLSSLPLDSPDVYDMACHADTVGVFQIESRAQMAMLPRLRPREFYDFVIEVAIVRPGPIQGRMVHPYLLQREMQRRDPAHRIAYPRPELADVLHKTLGVPLFQEQAMRLAVVAAGFTPEEADQLRRSMAAWKRSGGINRFHDKFVDGMLERGYEPEFAERCFQQVSGFGEYGFPESHAASFALIAYGSAWLKRYHPAAFTAGLLNSQPMGFYAPAQLVRDAREHGVEVRPVDVNHSLWDCTLEPPADATAMISTDGRPSSFVGRDASPHTWGRSGPVLRLGFRMVKGLRKDSAERIVSQRLAGGRFESIVQLHRRSGAPAAQIRKLAEADAFGSMGLVRRKSVWQAMQLHDSAGPLFDHLDHGDDPHVAALPEMPVGQEVRTDYATVGLSLKAHPLSLIRDRLTQLRIVTASQLQDDARFAHGRWVRVAGIVLVRQRPGTANGILFATLEDETGTINLIIRPGIYERYRTDTRTAVLLQADGYLQKQSGVVHVLPIRLVKQDSLLAGLDVLARDFH